MFSKIIEVPGIPRFGTDQVIVIYQIQIQISLKILIYTRKLLEMNCVQSHFMSLFSCLDLIAFLCELYQQKDE